MTPEHWTRRSRTHAARSARSCSAPSSTSDSTSQSRPAGRRIRADAVPHVVREEGVGRETVTLERVDGELARGRLLHPLIAAGTRHDRDPRPREVRVPVVRRRGELESRRSRSWSVRSAAPSRRRRSTPTGTSSSTTWSPRCAASATTSADGRRRSVRSTARAAARSRCSIRRARRRTASSAGRRNSSPYTETKAGVPSRKRAAVQGRRSAARDGIRAWYGKLWLAPNALKRRALTDTVKRRLPAVLDLRRARRCRLDGRGRPLLLHDRDLHGERPDAHAPGAARALGAGGGPPATFLRRRPRVRIGRRASGPAARRRAVPDRRAQALRRRLRRRLGRRALPDRPRRRRRSTRAPRWTPRRRRCARPQIPGDTYRNLKVRADYSGQTFKHILAPVWLLTLHVRREELPVR